MYSNNFGDDPIDRYTVAIIANDVQTIAQLPSAQGFADTAYLEKMSELTFDTAFRMGKASAEQWIPVSERLPEIDMAFPHSERYLVQYEDGGIDVAWWSNVNRFWTDHVTEPHWNCVQFQTVVAWMPLPKPWKGADDE